MADRIVVMHDGVVQQVGAPLDLYDRPANSFVAGFIGSPGMNFLPATIRRDKDAASAVFADGQSLPVLPDLPVADGDKVTLGLRPEHLRLSESGGLGAEVEVVEPLGLSTQFYAHIAGHQICVFVMGRVALAPGDRVTLTANPGDLHLFDPETGARIG